MQAKRRNETEIGGPPSSLFGEEPNSWRPSKGIAWQSENRTFELRRNLARNGI